MKKEEACPEGHARLLTYEVSFSSQVCATTSTIVTYICRSRAKSIVHPYLTILQLTLPYHTLPYLTSPYRTSLNLTLLYLALPYLAYRTFPSLPFPSLTLPHLTLPQVTLHCLTWPYHNVLYLILTYLTVPSRLPVPYST